MDGGNIHIAVCRQEFFTKISIEDAGKGIVPEWQRMNPNMRRSSGTQNIRIKEQLGGMDGQQVLGALSPFSQEEYQLERELKNIINRIIESNSEETIPRFADYRNYMTYEILITNDVLNRAKLSRQTGYSSGAEVQIPYLLILTSTLLMIYYQRTNSTRLVFIDEPFAKMDPGNVKLMLDFMKQQKLQVIFCSPDKTETIGNECEVILPVLRVRQDSMQLGIVQFYEREDGR